MFDYKNLITSYKFAKISNVVFSGVFLPKQIDELKVERYKIVKTINEFLYIRNLDFELKENDIIFCRTEDLKILFSLLSKVNLKNIKLISHQSDLEINRLIYLKKPKCISEWYSINVNFKAKDLISIPIGLANEHPKNLSENFFIHEDIRNSFFENKSESKILFINFQKSTNPKERSGLYEHYKNCEWVDVQNPNLSKQEYFTKMKESYYTLTPFGNGYDTHRFWEALYSGSVPILKKHLSYDYAQGLPVIFVNELDQIDEEYLRRKLKELREKQYNFEKLSFDFWKIKISKNEIINEGKVDIKLTGFKVKVFELSYIIFHKVNSIKKKYLYHFKRVASFLKSLFKVSKK